MSACQLRARHAPERGSPKAATQPAEGSCRVAAASRGRGGAAWATIRSIAALSEDSPVGRFLADRGPGMHHVAYRVADIDAAFAGLLARGVEMIDPAPRPGLRDSRIAFIHPRSTGGVLTEIVEAAG